MTNYKYLLFDVDGTIIESGPGVENSYQYALDTLGYNVKVKRKDIIGPPIKQSMMEIYGLTEEDATKGLELYRERYDRIGKKDETFLYDGIDTVLKKCKEKGYIVATATSKPEYFTTFILDNLNVSQYIDFIGAATLDKSRSTKETVIEYVLESLGVEDKSQVLLIGDTKFDLIGAETIGIDALAVAYGYGTMEELKSYKSIYIAKDMKELEDYLC
ncbi:MAG: HAD family hydrolase [Ruminococcaceae bacterium]|nr:HAD family hydrolase [Oscillospiraceae bacterium]